MNRGSQPRVDTKDCIKEDKLKPNLQELRLHIVCISRLVNMIAADNKVLGDL